MFARTRRAAALLLEALQIVALFRSVGYSLDPFAVKVLLLADVSHFKFMDVELGSHGQKEPVILGYYCDLLSNMYMFLCSLGTLGVGILITRTFSKIKAIHLAKLAARVYRLAFIPVLYNLLLGVKYRSSVELRSTITTVTLAVSFIFIFVFATIKSWMSLGLHMEQIIAHGIQEFCDGFKEEKAAVWKYFCSKIAFEVFIIVWAVIYDNKFSQSNFSLIVASAMVFGILAVIFRPYESRCVNFLSIILKIFAAGVLAIGASSLNSDVDQTEICSIFIILLLCLMPITCCVYFFSGSCQSHDGRKPVNSSAPEDPIPTDAHVPASEPIQSARSRKVPLKSALKKNRVFASTSNQDSPPIIFDRLSPSRRSAQGSEVTVLSSPQRSPGTISSSGLIVSPQGLGNSSRFNRRHLTPPPNRLFFGGRVSNLP